MNRSDIIPKDMMRFTPEDLMDRLDDIDPDHLIEMARSISNEQYVSAACVKWANGIIRVMGELSRLYQDGQEMSEPRPQTYRFPRLPVRLVD